MWQHQKNIKELQERLAERDGRIVELERERQPREFAPLARSINTASQREILELKAEIKDLYRLVQEKNDNDTKEELQKLQAELAKMHTTVKKQRNRLLLSQISPPRTRSRKKREIRLPTIPEEEEPAIEQPPAPAVPEKQTVVEPAVEEKEEEPHEEEFISLPVEEEDPKPEDSDTPESESQPPPQEQ